MKTNLHRWEKLISTVNCSSVGTLVLIDKTPLHQATDFFSKKEKGISANLIILKRPRYEPTHDSQSLITLEDGLWIIQMHDDDEWEGSLEIPIESNDNAIVRTNFFLVNSGSNTEIADLNWPDCRSIFSLLPSRVWNRFSRLISEQGGHVAGSIDSSLNIAVNLIEPKLLSTRFRYFYDNRHWVSRYRSKKHLIRLTEEDGWEDFATIEMSLVSRTIDGIASLIFFRDLYPDVDLRMQIAKWISVTKPHGLRTYWKKTELIILVLCSKLFEMLNNLVLGDMQQPFRNAVLYRRILVTAWEGKEAKDYLEIVEILLKLDSLPLLKSRFDFWQRELRKYIFDIPQNDRW